MLALTALLMLGVPSADADPAREIFLRELKASADCPRLFELRNRAKVGATEATRADMNARLQSIGCYTSTSKRKSPSGATTTFTVREYRIYRRIIDAPMSMPEAEALDRAAKEFGLTPAQARKVADKVQALLLENRWFGRPEAEIRHASDWKDEYVR